MTTKAKIVTAGVSALAMGLLTFIGYKTVKYIQADPKGDAIELTPKESDVIE